MTRQVINLGTLPNGAGGDTTRSANTKINDMTQELYAATDSLGTAARATLTVGNADTTPGRVLKNGDLGLGADCVLVGDWTAAYDDLGGAFIAGNAAYPGGTGESINATGISLRRSGRVGAQIMIYNGDNQFLFRSAFNGFLPWVRMYHTGNTTRMADNTLRAI
ncbi:Uncharacterised protein [Pseudomonas fluorescens]|nr:Uncharacterised protein [Pseudomonas fluorescens]